MQDLLGLTTLDLEQLAVRLGEAPYRGRQLIRHIYQNGVSEFELMADLPAAFRLLLAQEYRVGIPQVAAEATSADSTVKYLLSLADGESVETVYLPYSNRVSVCLSSQVGCPAGCTFCATAIGGLVRNLTSGEIAGQLLCVQQRQPARRISHAVFMGMGEPLLNYDATVGAVRLLTGEAGLSARHITLSTVGVVPGILKLATERLPVTLALSLHAPDDSLREQLIPTARKWKLNEILAACGEFHRATRRDLTFEYLLIAGVNDDPGMARRMAHLLKGLPGNVNLIPFNFVDTENGFKRPDRASIERFRAELEMCGRTVTQRMERGHSIQAACGQLRRSLRTVGNTLNLVSGLPTVG